MGTVSRIGQTAYGGIGLPKAFRQRPLGESAEVEPRNVSRQATVKVRGAWELRALEK